MKASVRVGGWIVAVLLGALLAYLGRDGACLDSLPAQCSRSYGTMSYLYLGLGFLVGALWYFLTRPRARN